MRQQAAHDKADHPTVAVVIACYNQAHFLRDALSSVRAQTRQVDEVILVDDGSADDTRKVAADCSQADYVHQRNAGLSAARNTGLARVKSEYVLFLDADDILKPDALAQAVRALSARDELGFVYGGYEEVTETREMLSRRMPTSYPDAFLALLRQSNFIAMHGTVLYRTTLVRQANGFDVSLRCCEDLDLYLRLTRKHPIAAYQAIASEYRRHGGSMSAEEPRMVASARQVLFRHAQTKEERAAAGHGFAIIADFYAGAFWAKVTDAVRRKHAGRLFHLARDFARAPQAWRALLVRRFSPPSRSDQA